MQLLFPDNVFCSLFFAGVVRKRGNDRYREPVCRPLSMLMHSQEQPLYSYENKSQEWYSKWLTQNDGMKRSDSHSSEGSSYDGTSYGYTSTACETMDYTLSREDYESESDTHSSQGDDDDESWEIDTPECGTLRNVRQKIGEHVSRVHPLYTSSLRQSRFRKKWFPRGTFPY